jgi:hypothetical protein
LKNKKIEGAIGISSTTKRFAASDRSFVNRKSIKQHVIFQKLKQFIRHNAFAKTDKEEEAEDRLREDDGQVRGHEKDA